MILNIIVQVVIPTIFMVVSIKLILLNISAAKVISGISKYDDYAVMAKTNIAVFAYIAIVLFVLAAHNLLELLSS